MRRPGRRLSRLLLVALGLLVLVPGVGAGSCKLFLDCGSGDVDGGGDVPTVHVDRPGIVDTVVASGFAASSSFAFLPDGRILVGQVDGLIYVVKGGEVVAEPFLDLRNRVNTARKRGFVGLEPDPDFARNHHVYLMYAYDDDGGSDEEADTGVRVTRVTANGDRASPESEVVVLGGAGRSSCTDLPVAADCIPARGIHTGGGLAFAGNGTLFVGTGDGEAGLPQVYEAGAQRAQDLDSLSGKVLRVTPAGKGLRTNPFWTGDADDNLSKVWAYGVRNPFRLTVRPGTGLPYVGDVGWDNFDEIDVAIRGANLGWPCYEGRRRPLHYRDTALCAGLYGRGRVRFPLVVLPHQLESGSVTGGEFRGPSDYVYGDYGKQWLRTLRVDADDRLVRDSHGGWRWGRRRPPRSASGPKAMSTTSRSPARSTGSVP